MMKIQNCCCFNLRTGTMILGWIGLACSIISFVRSFSIRDDMEILHKYIDDDDSYQIVVNTLVSTTFSIAIVEIIMNICLLVGALKNKRLLLIPYLITQGISCFGIAMFLLFLVTILFSPEVSDKAPVSALLLFAFIYFSIVFYFWLSVYSFYHHLRIQESCNHQRLQEEGSVLDSRQLVLEAKMEESPPPSYHTLVQQ